MCGKSDDTTASGWQRVKMGFKGREREERIDLDKGREKARKFKQLEIATKVRKT